MLTKKEWFTGSKLSYSDLIQRDHTHSEVVLRIRMINEVQKCSVLY